MSMAVNNSLTRSSSRRWDAQGLSLEPRTRTQSWDCSRPSVTPTSRLNVHSKSSTRMGQNKSLSPRWCRHCPKSVSQPRVKLSTTCSSYVTMMAMIESPVHNWKDCITKWSRSPKISRIKSTQNSSIGNWLLYSSWKRYRSSSRPVSQRHSRSLMMMEILF